MTKGKKSPKRKTLAGAPTLLLDKPIAKSKSVVVGDYTKQTFRRANKPHTRR